MSHIAYYDDISSNLTQVKKKLIQGFQATEYNVIYNMIDAIIAQSFQRRKKQTWIYFGVK